MSVHIVAGGPLSRIPDLSCFDGNDVSWIGVDSGARTLLNAGIRCKMAFGDFDSVTVKEKQEIMSHAEKIVEYPVDKDASDLELALRWALEKIGKPVILFGATGGRLDHELANIRLLELGLKHRIRIRIVDRENEIELKGPGEYTIQKDGIRDIVSFLPYSPKVNGFTLRGFRYSADNLQIVSSSTRTISNQLCTKIGHYSFQSGILMVIRSCG